jgi:hypothetical protein
VRYSFPGFVLLDLRCFVAVVLLVFLIRQGLAVDYFFASVSQFILPLRAQAPRVVHLASALFFLTNFSWGQVSALISLVLRFPLQLRFALADPDSRSFFPGALCRFCP